MTEEQKDTGANKGNSPPAAVAGISHFRSKGRGNSKLPQFLKILWEMESVGISPTHFQHRHLRNGSAQPSTAETCAGLASMRSSACPPQISSLTGQCLKHREREQTGHMRAADLPLLGASLPHIRGAHSQQTQTHTCQSGSFYTLAECQAGAPAVHLRWCCSSLLGRNRLISPSNTAFVQTE